MFSFSDHGESKRCSCLGYDVRMAGARNVRASVKPHTVKSSALMLPMTHCFVPTGHNMSPDHIQAKL